MYPVRYIHAADLHLDAAFKGLSREAGPRGAEALQRLQRAGFTALERLFALAEAERPDFLVIAGDMYNQEDAGLRAQLRLRDACERLSAFGIQVFLAHGNHDPLPSRLHTLKWPSNVTVFGPEPESRAVTREGEAVAVVHGISHESAAEGRNLAALFKRDPASCFQLGVLHCTVEGSRAERYAPCGLEDLRASGLDAWALGHVHERTVLSEFPFIAYSGNTQGLHINERGQRGCLLVSAAPSDGGFACSATFKPLGPVIWEQSDVAVDGMDSLDAVDNALRNAVEQLAAEAPAGCEALIARLRLTGRSALDGELRRPAGLDAPAERLREPHFRIPVWIKDIEVHTRPAVEPADLRNREDLLGETLRLAEEGRADPHSLRLLVEQCLPQLPGREGIRAVLPPLTDEECAQLLAEAERLCIDLLEAE